MLTGQMFHIPIVLAINYLAHGCPLVLMNFDAKLAMELIQQERVSAFLGVTTMLNWMMAVPGFDDYDISSLRNIQYGGGPMPSRVIKEAAMDKFPCTMIQGYGQTEGTTMCFLSQEDHIRAIRDEGYHPERLKSCGREGFVTSVRVVDDDGNDVPTDGKTPGQIIVKSEANMLGYFRRPDLTEQTIRDGWMWTGDIATMDEERYVFIVDRAKDMIISGGENIYSVQVEEAIAKHDAGPRGRRHRHPRRRVGRVGEGLRGPEARHRGHRGPRSSRRPGRTWRRTRSPAVGGVHRRALPKAPTGKILKRVLRDPYWVDEERNDV